MFTFPVLNIPARTTVQVPADQRTVRVRAGRRKVVITLPEFVSNPLIVNYGMGTDSTAMLVLMVEMYKAGNTDARPDKIMFADTGSEKSETYAYIDTMQAYLKANNFPEITIVSKGKRGTSKDTSLHASSLRLNTMPSLAYGGKSCSLKWKVAEMDHHLTTWMPAMMSWAVGLPIIKLIGYDGSPADMRRSTNPGDAKIGFGYPLRDAGLKRPELIQIIEAAGLPQPGKSACFMCPASKRYEVVTLAEREPKLAAIALRIEAHALLNSIMNGKLSSTIGLGRNWSWHDTLTEAGLVEGLSAQYDTGADEYALYLLLSAEAKAAGKPVTDETEISDEAVETEDSPCFIEV